MPYPETKAERKKRLRPYLDTHATCPTTNGRDLEVWEELKAQKVKEDLTKKENQP